MAVTRSGGGVGADGETRCGNPCHLTLVARAKLKTTRCLPWATVPPSTFLTKAPRIILIRQQRELSMSSEKKTDETTEIIQVLPGETEVDTVLVDQAVDELNRLYVTKGLETYTAVGQYVVDTFFDGDYANFNKRGDGHLTFHDLATRDDLIVSKSVLHRSVQILELHKRLGEPEWRRVTATHYREVLALEDKHQATLLERAEKEGWSSRELAVAAKKKKPSDGRGRPPLPSFVKAIGKLGKLVDDHETLFGDFDKLEKLDPLEAEALYQRVLDVRKACEDLQDRLRPRVPGFAAPEPAAGKEAAPEGE